MSQSSKPKSEPAGAVSPRVVAVVFMAVAFGVSLLLYNRAFSPYDDGIAAEGARQILKGRVPYRDFWALYAPGSYYANALVLAAFGHSLLAIRAALPIMVFAQAGLICGMLRRTSCNSWAAAVAGLAYLGFIPFGITTTNPMTYWLTFALAGAYAFVRWVESGKPLWACWAGLALGVSALFRQDGGVYATAAFCLAAYLIGPRIGSSKWGAVARVAGPFVAVCAAMTAYLAAKGALGPMFQDMVVFAVTKFPKSRQLPYPLPWNPLRIMGYYFCPRSIAFAYQLFIFWILPGGLVGLAWAALIRLVRDEPDRPRMAACALAGAAAVLFLMVAVRPVGMRVSGSVMLGLVSFAAFSGDRSRWVRGAARLLLIGSAVAYVLCGAAWVWGQRAYGVEMLEMRGGVYSGRGHATMIDIASSYIFEHTRPSERIFSGDPVIYFTAARDAATKYYEPHPLLTDTPGIQRIIIRDIEREHVRYIVRSREWDVGDCWFTIERNHQPKMLIRYIRSNYEIVPCFGTPGVPESRLLVYRRKTPFGHRLSKETL